MKRLPHELCFAISDYLYFEDLLRVRLVSRSWYEAFCRTDICAHAIQKQSSSPLEQFFKRFGVNYAKLDEEMKDDCHRKFMINRIRREHGIATSIYELDYDLTDLNEALFLYSEGRVAICYREKIIVEDLNTRHRSIFEYPPNTNRRVAGSPRLVGQFLISSFSYNGANSQLVIWNVISRRMHLIPMHQVIYSSTSNQNQVGLVVTNPSFFGSELLFLTWDEESGLKRLINIQQIENPKERNLSARIFFHPSKKGVVFITIQTRMYTKYDSSTYGTRIMVYCYEEGRLVYTQQEILKTTTIPVEYDTKKYDNDNQICFFAREPPFGWIPPNLTPYIFVRRTSFTNQGPEVRWVQVPRSENRAPPDQESLVDQERLFAENQPSNVRRDSHVRWIEQPNGLIPLIDYRISSDKSSDETFYEHLIYDMSKREFFHFKAKLHLTYQECLFRHGSLIWNDQVLIRACHDNVEKLHVITLSKRLSGLWNGSIGKNDHSCLNRSSILRGETRSGYESSSFEFNDKLQVNPDIKVYGDDNFVVLRAGKLAKVWKFDEFRYKKLDKLCV